MKIVHDRPEVEKEFSLWQKMKAKLTDTLRKLAEHQSSRALDVRADRKRNAKALLDGKPIVDDAAERRETLGELHRDRFVTLDAIELQKRRHADSMDRGGREMVEEAGPALEEAAQHLADTLVIASEAADNLTKMYDALEDRGVVVSTKYPAVHLGNLRASDPASWANMVLDDLERDFGTKVNRGVLDAAEKAREKVHLAEQKQKQRTGHAQYAGPNGSGTFSKSGKREPNEVGVLSVPPALIPGNPAVAR